ncbi:MAG: hypothetical protein WBK84_04655, partial [Limnochordia bacterium]
MRDTLFLRMRQSGWFDILVLLAAIGIMITGLGIAGVVQYRVRMARMPEGLTPFEIREALGSLARSRQTFLKVGLVGLGGTLVGFALLTIASHFRDRVSYQTKKKLKKVTVALQYLVAVVVTLIVLFPIYWMVISSLKTSEELLLPVPTLWPREFQWANYPSVLERAPFLR